MEGQVVETYKLLYSSDGELISRTLVSKDTYRTQDRIILVGRPPASEPQQEQQQQQQQQNPSIDYIDYGIIIKNNGVDFGPYNNMSLGEFPLDAFIAWCLGSDGAYAAAANQVLFERFLADPDGILEYFALIGDNVVRNESVKVLLCRKLAVGAISRNEFEGNNRVSLIESIDELKAKYQSGVKVDLLSLISEQYDSYIKENFG